MKKILQLSRPSVRNAIRIVQHTKSHARYSSNPNMSSSPLDITAPPAVDQHILHDGKEYTTVREGLAYILVPANAPKVPQGKPNGESQPQSVFYNPIQQFNRDLSVLAIKAFGEQFLESRKPKKDKQRHKKQDKKRKHEDDGDKDSSAKKVSKSDKAIPNAESENPIEIGTTAIAQNGDTEAPSNTEPAQKHDVDTTMADGAPAIERSNEEPPQKVAPPPTFTILDALSATGLRALRYSHEIPFVTSVTANDLLEEATKSIELNVKHNKLEKKIKSVTGNALTHMYSFVGDSCKDDKGKARHSRKYHVIDLDPYGTAAPFLDAAVQAVRDDGGLLCVTCTDAGVWASNGYPEKAFSLYGGLPTKGQQSHEGGLRLILHSIASSAARYGLAMEPLLSLSIDFYARVFVRIHKSANDVKFLSGRTMIVYNCDQGCGAWTTQTVGKNKVVTSKKGGVHMWKHTMGLGPSASENCAHCGTRTHIGGPMYAGPLHSPEFIQRILDDLPKASEETYHTTTRIKGMLTLALEENIPPKEDENSPTSTSKTNKYDPSTIDPAPFLFLPSTLAKVIHCVTPLESAFRGALRYLGYRVTRSHTKPGSIKTDAPWDVIWEVMREWAKQKAPIREGAIREGTPGYKLMGLDKLKKPAEGQENEDQESAKVPIEVVFDEKLGADVREKKLVRYQLNPRENWGPMSRAKGKE